MSALVENDHGVVIFDDLFSGSVNNLETASCEFIEASITEDDVVLQAASNVDAIAHPAPLGSVPRSSACPITSHDVIAIGTQIVLRATR